MFSKLNTFYWTLCGGCHTMVLMKTRIGTATRIEFKERAGGRDEAISQIMVCLKDFRCSMSKAEKVYMGTYPHELSPAEKRALSDLFLKPIEVLFEPASKRTGKAS